MSTLIARRSGRAGLSDLLEDQFWMISRAQALGYGMSRAALRHRLRALGPWQVVLPGVYAAQTGKLSLLQRQMAAVLYAGPGSMITGSAALQHHDIRAAQTDHIDVLVPLQRKRHDAGFARLHRTARLPEPVPYLARLSYAPPYRAVADTVRWLPDVREARAVVAAAVQHGRCTIQELAGELQSGPDRDSGTLRLVLAEVADGVRSTAEADLRLLIKRERLPEPLYNPRLYAGETFIAMPDCWWPAFGVAAEVDSREWHLSPADWEKTMAGARLNCEVLG
jgi:hypothetical protein